jgi:hypothetical protein
LIGGIAGKERAVAVNDEGFERTIGLRSAVAINMTQMCGIGPFVTIPLMIAAFGGPQAIFGWIVGALLALADGLVWAELGAALPGAGGTYLSTCARRSSTARAGSCRSCSSGPRCSRSR